MRISVQRKIREVDQSRSATVIIDLAICRISADPLCNLDIEQVRRVQCLLRVEEPFFRSLLLLAYRGELRVEPKRQQRSLPVAFGANCLRRLHGKSCLRAALQSCTQLIEGRPLGYPANLVEQVVGESDLPRQRRARFEVTMQCIRNITNLNYRCHVYNMKPCAPHVQRRRERLGANAERATWVA